MGKKNEVEVAASGSVGAEQGTDPAYQAVLDDLKKAQDSVVTLESKLKGTTVLLDKRVAEVSALESEIKSLRTQIEESLTKKSEDGISKEMVFVINGEDYNVEHHELLRDLIHLWRQQYVKDDCHVLVLKKKS